MKKEEQDKPRPAGKRTDSAAARENKAENNIRTLVTRSLCAILIILLFIFRHSIFHPKTAAQLYQLNRYGTLVTIFAVFLLFISLHNLLQTYKEKKKMKELEELIGYWGLVIRILICILLVFLTVYRNKIFNLQTSSASIWVGAVLIPLTYLVFAGILQSCTTLHAVYQKKHSSKKQPDRTVHKLYSFDEFLEMLLDKYGPVEVTLDLNGRAVNIGNHFDIEKDGFREKLIRVGHFIEEEQFDETEAFVAALRELTRADYISVIAIDGVAMKTILKSEAKAKEKARAKAEKQQSK